MNLEVPPAEIDINESVVRDLINAQFPQFKDLEIRFLDSGWDNENYRLGNEYIIRLPRRAAAIPLIQNEIEWLPKLESALSIAIPAPRFVGNPTTNYPWQWSIVPWINGKNACIRKANDAQALRLSRFLKELHQFPHTTAPYNDHRCLPLSDKSEEVIERINRLKNISIVVKDQILDRWNVAVNEEVPNIQSLIHGDLHPRNVIIKDGRIDAIIDWGDMTAGDVATDLSSIWMLFDNRETRTSAFENYGADPSAIIRAQGWAIFSGTLFLDLGDVANGEYKQSGQQIIENILSQ